MAESKETLAEGLMKELTGGLMIMLTYSKVDTRRFRYAPSTLRVNIQLGVRWNFGD
jgi:hypothetical protein